jgi:hypothetical protein
MPPTRTITRKSIERIGLDVRNHRWLAFTLAGAAAGLAGGLYAFMKGSIDPSILQRVEEGGANERSHDGLDAADQNHHQEVDREPSRWRAPRPGSRAGSTPS